MPEATIDYEAEYNNRARVPDHPAIIAAWARDAAAYRDALKPVVIRYGASERQAIDVFVPAPDASPAAVMFIHGGYWQALDRSCFSHMARGLNRHGVTVAVAGYDLCPQVRIGDIVDEIRSACREMARFGRCVVVAGHSAGGHLAACMLATNWRAVGAALPERLVAAAFAISGLFDLKPLLATSVNGALGMDAAEAERFSPLSWKPPEGLVLDAVVGGEESTEYRRQSRAIVETWGAAGVATRYVEVPAANHFTVIAPLADPGSSMVARLVELAGR